MEQEQRFKSRVDAWLYAVVFGPMFISLFSIFQGRQQTGSDAPSTILLSLAILALPMGFLIWILFDTSYSVTDLELVIRSGPTRLRVPIANIRSVRRTSSLWSAPALSLRRMEIQYAGAGGSQERVVISPADFDAFLSVLTARNSRIQRMDGI